MVPPDLVRDSAAVAFAELDKVNAEIVRLRLELANAEAQVEHFREAWRELAAWADKYAPEAAS